MTAAEHRLKSSEAIARASVCLAYARSMYGSVDTRIEGIGWLCFARSEMWLSLRHDRAARRIEREAREHAPSPHRGQLGQ